MKQIKTIYTLLLAVALTLLTACTFGDETTENGTEQKDGKVTVRFRVSQAAPATTRAADTPDTNAESKELMNIWTVVAVKENKVVWVQTCAPTGDEREIDDLVEMETGDYTFYSFANIGASYIEDLFGLGSGTIPTPPSDNTPASNTLDTQVDISSKDIDNATAKAIGNNFNAFENDNTKDNGFGSYGIPMSNKQTITINDNTNTVDLIVVRMLAKIKLEITNSGADDVTITSIALTDITKNGDNTLKLFPKYTNPKNANTMEAMHGDIQPNLNGNPETDEYKITPSSPGVTVSSSDNPSTPLAPSTPWTIETGKSLNITFYVNESENPKGENWGKDKDGTTQQFNRYFLKIKMKSGEKDEEVRYTLIDDKNANTDDTGKWDYIARNDYRIIPIVLDDYKLDMIPYDFPAIGVYPASVKEEDGIYTITFHDYGHFHLVPQVTKYSNQETLVPYDKTDGDYWTLYGNDFSTAWGSWTDATKTTLGTGDFYRKDHTNDLDGDDAGGVPVWYPNNPSDPSTPNSPQWSPDGKNYPPFIFGYIADPGESIKNGDKKVYHEFTINLYKSGSSAPRQMTYRLYMILDQDQMLYRSRSLAAPAPRHTHGH